VSDQLLALLISLAVEVPVAVGLVKLARFEVQNWRRLLLVLPAVTLLTHPFAWTVNQDLFHWDPYARLALIEASVVLIEGLIIGHWGKLGFKAGFTVALVANALSFAVGLVLF